MEPSGISVEEFSRLQNQLIELRTENYEISEKFKKTTEENNLLREKAESREKDVQKLNKLMKIPGLQALSKHRNKKNYDEILEENERLMQQMQRHEEDFNLQNKTLLEEVSRLSLEKDSLDAELEKLKDLKARGHDESDEMRRIKAENKVLLKKIQEQGNFSKGIKHETEGTSTDHETSSDSNEDDQPFHLYIEGLREIISTQLKHVLVNKERMKQTEIENNEDSHAAEENERKFTENILEYIKDFIQKTSRGNNNEGLNVQLETQQTENKLLRDQLEGEREQTQKNTAVLKAEIDKLTEKTKRKQESYNQLQEEKETLHKEKRYLEQEWITSKEKLAIAEENAAELQQRLVEIGEENEKLRQETVTLKQQAEQCSIEKLTELEKITKEKTEDLLSLKSQLQETAASNQELMSELQKLSVEKEELEKISKTNHELAEKRKKLLDQISLERQHELTSHNEVLEESKNQTEEQRRMLEACMSDLEKSKREVTVASDRHAELLKKYSSLENKSGWLERTLKETENQIEERHQNHLHSLESKEKEMQDKIDALSVEHELDVKAINETKEEIERERDEKICIIEKMNQASKDREIEFRISGKKGDQLLRDLKKQLKTERKRADQIQQRLQDFLTDSKSKQTFDEIFKADSSIFKGHRRQDSGSHLSTVSSNSGLESAIDIDNTKSSTPLSGTPLSAGSDAYKLSNETVELISKVSDLQLEKNVLEEKVRHLEENTSVLVEDLMRKTEIIQKYIRDTKKDLNPESVKKKNMTLKEKMKDSLNIGKHGKSEDMLKEMNAKMQRLLEETLEKNLQLEKDVDHLTRELEKTFKSD